ncbi:MAG: alpha/beta hydrolase fold protein [Ignavibacteria bacterium]|nr:MAG: alpha/beta hydrolase fold protein [Ignavibacteria bacterium]KAF0155897.1 MAG: alpha/beta hydrolase fold protein [Ignavibacteria bacterium]
MKYLINRIAVNTFGLPSNKPVVFIHGFPYDHSMWQNQIDCLKEEYFCVAYDVRGLGESEVGDGQYILEHFVDDLFSIIDELKLVSPFLCGLSMGGYIALRAVERNQELFGGLILCDTKAEADNDSAKITRANNIKMINTDGLDKFTEMFVTNCFADETPKQHEKMFSSILKKTQMNNPVGVKGCIIAIMSRTDTTNFLQQINLPTLVICGSFDKLTPPQVMRAMAERIPNSEFASIPFAGHMSPLENPDCVNDLMKGFLAKNFIS